MARGCSRIFILTIDIRSNNYRIENKLYSKHTGVPFRQFENLLRAGRGSVFAV